MLGMYMESKVQDTRNGRLALSQSAPRKCAPTFFFRRKYEKFAATRKEKWNTVKKAFVSRNEDGDSTLKMTIRYPAAQIVACLLYTSPSPRD